MRFEKDGRRFFTCLGRQEGTAANWVELNHYRELLALKPSGRMCVQGAGLSLSGAGFSAAADVLGMRRFNRVLEIDRDTKVVHVEAGITLGRLFGVLAKYGFILAVQPGHPDITIGGCIAGNVHGKNPCKDGVFSGLVKEITLFHPAHGVCVLSPDRGSQLFDLTCGGLGLTGIIISARLALDAFPVTGIEIIHRSFDGPIEALSILRESSEDQAYAWLDFARHDRRMGRGFVAVGRRCPRSDSASPVRVPSYPPLRTEDAWPVGLFNRFSLPFINAAYAYINSPRSQRCIGAFDAFFPFANRIQYFHAYGPSGFVEHQSLVPLAAFSAYVKKLMETLRRRRQVCGLAAMKLFAGKRHLLSFSGDGVSIAIHLPGGPDAHACLRDIDELDCEHGAIANVIKDARLSGEVVQRQYGDDYALFRQRLHEFDPRRMFVSAVSERLEL